MVTPTMETLLAEGRACIKVRDRELKVDQLLFKVEPFTQESGEME
jgi:hypothetical protein